MTEKRSIVIYSRKSKFTGKGESIENQVEMCRQYIRLHFGSDAADSAKIYEDEGFSGSTLDRPQFKAMMSAAKKGSFKALVVYRLDRVSRNISDFAGLIEELNRMNIDFISIREQFDTSSPMGRAMMYISSVFSQLERETIAERLRDNMHELAKSGRWLGGVTPTGYISESTVNIMVDGRSKKASQLKILPEEAAIVRLIFDNFIQNTSLTKTEAFLLQNGIHTKNGKYFTRFTIKGILCNPVYMIADEAAYRYLSDRNVDLFAEENDFDGKHGIMAYNRTLQQAGKAHQVKPMEEWIVAVGRHEGIVEGCLWVKAQELLEINKNKSYRKPRNNTALLSGMLVCAECGSFMRPKLVQGDYAEGRSYNYICSLKERSRGQLCSMKNCRGRVLDAEVLKKICELDEDRSIFYNQLELNKRSIMNSRIDVDEVERSVLNDIASVEKEIESLLMALSQGDNTCAKTYIMQHINEKHGIKQELEQRLHAHKIHLYEEKIDIAEQTRLLMSFSDLTANISVEQQRAIIRKLIDKVVWDGKTADIVCKGAQYRAAITSDHMPSGEYSK